MLFYQTNNNSFKMKKLNIYFVIILAVVFVFSSCQNNKTELPALKSQIDSLNYAFGLSNGNGIKNYYLANDTANADTLKQKINALLDGIAQGMKSKVDPKYAEIAELGTRIGSALKEQKEKGLMNDSSLVLNMKLIKQGLINGLKGSDIQMTAQEAQAYLNSTMQRRQEKQAEITYKANKEAGEKFLAENKLRDSVVTTASGLQYKVLKLGKGALPTDTSRVKVHYHGTLIDGTVFDSSVNRGEPAIFGVNQVIKGWTEALKLMPVGSKYRLFIPQELAYGKQDQGTIKPFSALIFDVELISIEK
jgi:FKBP-type peptidyl-prolyl cis-trans isomerase FklB